MTDFSCLLGSVDVKEDLLSSYLAEASASENQLMLLLALETDGHVGDYSVDMKMIVKVLSGKIFGQGVGGAFCYQNHSKPYTSNFEGAEAEAEAEAQTPILLSKPKQYHQIKTR